MIILKKNYSKKEVIANVKLKGLNNCGKRGKENNNKYIDKIRKGPR